MESPRLFFPQNQEQSEPYASWDAIPVPKREMLRMVGELGIAPNVMRFWCRSHCICKGDSVELMGVVFDASQFVEGIRLKTRFVYVARVLVSHGYPWLLMPWQEFPNAQDATEGGVA